MDLKIDQLRFHKNGPYDLDIAGGHSVGLLGPSGSGKTLLLRAIADLDPSQGKISLGEKQRIGLTAPQWRLKVGYLPAEPAWWFDSARSHFATIDHDLLDQLGLDKGIIDRPLMHLSTGERQRLALLRLLANGPQALLLDEPTASLDGNATMQVEQLITDYRQKHSVPVLWVSHDPSQLDRVADQTLTLTASTLEHAT